MVRATAPPTGEAAKGPRDSSERGRPRVVAPEADERTSRPNAADEDVANELLSCPRPPPSRLERRSTSARGGAAACLSTGARSSRGNQTALRPGECALVWCRDCGPLGQGRSARPDATATPSVQMVSMRELHAVLRLPTFIGASLALHLLVSAERFRTNFRDANLTRARTKRTPRANRAPGIEPRTAAPDLAQRTLPSYPGSPRQCASRRPVRPHPAD